MLKWTVPIVIPMTICTRNTMREGLTFIPEFDTPISNKIAVWIIANIEDLFSDLEGVEKNMQEYVKKTLHLEVEVWFTVDSDGGRKAKNAKCCHEEYPKYVQAWAENEAMKEVEKGVLV